MSYDDFNASAAGGNPVQLYRFVYGTEADEYVAYTTHTQAITVDHGDPVGEITYEPVPIDRDNIVSNGTLDKSAIKITLDIGTELAELYRIYPPSLVTILTMYEGHLDDPDGEFVVIWAGRIVSAERAHSELQLSGEPISTQMKRPGLRRHYQYGCPLVLYGQDLGFGGCGANKAAATLAATVDSIAGTVVTLDGGWEGAFDPDKFVRGTIEWTPAGESTRRRTILRIDGDDLTVSGILDSLDDGDSVSVVLGCNHRAFTADGGDCEGLHDTLITFGGHPWIPTKNVINKNPFY